MATLKCTKDLINDRGIQDFTKGKEYLVIGEIRGVFDRTVVRDDFGDPHTLGKWAKYFKIVKK